MNGGIELAFQLDGVVPWGRNFNEYMLKLTNPKQHTVHAAPYAVEIYRRLGLVETDAERIEDGNRYTPMRLQREIHKRRLLE